jgi:hypothetical protein
MVVMRIVRVRKVKACYIMRVNRVSRLEMFW